MEKKSARSVFTPDAFFVSSRMSETSQTETNFTSCIAETRIHAHHTSTHHGYQLMGTQHTVFQKFPTSLEQNHQDFI